MIHTRHLPIHTWHLNICRNAAPRLVSRRSRQVFVTRRLQLAFVRRPLQMASCQMLLQGTMKVKITGQETLPSTQASCFFLLLGLNISPILFQISLSLLQSLSYNDHVPDSDKTIFWHKIRTKFGYNCLIGLEF
jgi:hypothetical protein